MDSTLRSVSSDENASLPSFLRSTPRTEEEEEEEEEAQEGKCARRARLTGEPGVY